MFAIHSDMSRRKTGCAIMQGLEIEGTDVAMWCGLSVMESREMIPETAVFLSQSGVQILRGGAYRLRISPFSFKVFVEKTSKWLAEAREHFHMITVSEVLDSHVVSLIITKLMRMGMGGGICRCES